jgi:hypothetical protein
MGAFVYQRKNAVRDGADFCERRCKRWACELQVCIARLPAATHTLRMDLSKCDVFLEKYNSCCAAVKAELGMQKQDG